MQGCLIIANRGAGTFGQQRLDHACRSLEAAGRPVELCYCDDFSEMTVAAAQASSGPVPRAVIAAGGDGTINAVFNGLAGNAAVCAILPLGTANVLAIELGINSLDAAVARIINGTPRAFTAGLISNGAKSSYFFLMAGAGFDGAVVRGVTPELKKRYGKGAYAISALKRLTSWESGELLVTTEERQFSCHSIIACNAAHYGGPYRLAPAASIFTPTLELLAVCGTARRSLVALTTAVIGSRQGNSLSRFTVKRLQISGNKPVQVDGDDWGDSPVTITAAENFASIIV